MTFEEWFNKEFPDHEDGCLYGKLALNMAWKACERQSNNYFQNEINEIYLNYADRLKELRSENDRLAKHIVELQKDKGRLTDQLTRAKEIIIGSTTKNPTGIYLVT